MPIAAALSSPVIRYAAIFFAGMAIGATVNGWRLGGEIADIKAEHAAQLQGVAEVAARASQDAMEQQAQAVRNLATLDRRYTDEIARNREETDRLHAAVVSGERRLRIQASCPAGGNSLPDAAAAAGVDDAPAPRLDDTAERDYWTLRERIGVITAQVSALQAYITTSCLTEAP